MFKEFVTFIYLLVIAIILSTALIKTGSNIECYKLPISEKAK